MFPTRTHFAILAMTLGLIGCRGHGPQPQEAAAGAEAAYLTPPSVTAANRQDQAFTVSGDATPGSAVRLASPAGEAVTATADARGRWSLTLPAAGDARIYGLSMTAGGRRIQGEGYLVTTPGGAAAVLRAGAGALRVDPQASAHIAAFDFDRDGESVVSGSAPADAALSVQVDGRQALDGRADDAGRYSLALPRLSPGAHQIQVLGDGFDDTVQVEVSPPQPLVSGPLRSQLIGDALRIDWLTPGGGVQSTILPG